MILSVVKWGEAAGETGLHVAPGIALKNTDALQGGVKPPRFEARPRYGEMSKLKWNGDGDPSPLKANITVRTARDARAGECYFPV
jgi:hypothetical protein